MKSYQWGRLIAVMQKEFIQMIRNKATFAMMVGIPLVQLILFGFAINFNPRHLPVAIVGDDHSVFTRDILSAMENSTYFQFIAPNVLAREANLLLKRGKVQFILSFPPNFSRKVVRGLRPKVALEVDATDPAASSYAIAAFQEIAIRSVAGNAVGALSYLSRQPGMIEPVVYSKYNPLAITAFNIVPGLLGVVLTMTMVIITAVAITREYERGTMENLLAMPVNPGEVMVGKLVPYIMVGYIQVLLILFFAGILFHVPMQGSILLLLFLCLPFIIANLSVGLMFSTVASDQLQATQSAMFFFLPSILLSGFMFPFRGMPEWAQWLGQIFPLTHFLIIVRGILLKGNTLIDLWRELLPILGFAGVMLMISIKRYKNTLD